jgi:hypothetical protein
MRPRALILIFFLLALAPVPAIGFFGSEEGQVLTSTDGQSQVSLPKGWKEHPGLNDMAEIQAANASKNLYIIVLTESKEDFEKMTLVKHSGLTRDGLMEGLSSAEYSGPQKLTVDGKPAIQYIIRGAYDNTNIVYLHTTVEGAKNYYQILVWTIKSGYQKNSAELQQMIEGFKEVQQGTASR